MTVSTDAIYGICTDAVYERGENYHAEGRIREIHRFDDAVTAIVRGSRHYDVRVDLVADGFDPRCSCPYDGPGACKHVVAVLLRCVEDLPPDEADRIDPVLEAADPEALRAFLREAIATDAGLRDRFLARSDEEGTRSVDGIRAEIDRRFEETNPDYDVVFEPVDLDEFLELAETHRSHGRHLAAATVYRGLTESLDDHMELVDGSYDHFTRAFTAALDGYVDCVAAAATDDAVDTAVSFLEDRATSGTPFLAERFERAAAELRDHTE
ncbi:SWIM zinc finger family protein [Halopenitus sp. POP-27]|uniref:SWIM zinc finger family protein n=1 Tax=Halopenitus sp. POP-27 TaxID=2994425 RepID=UPI002468881E|nr:SWIM zinc finger family protein [Halopenitus sp. POP-27]